MALDPEPSEPLPPDAPEADVVEQRLPVTSEDQSPEPPHLGAEVPEADAIEQTLPAPPEEEGYETA
jgi:hypothetical protein